MLHHQTEQLLQGAKCEAHHIAFFVEAYIFKESTVHSTKRHVQKVKPGFFIRLHVIVYGIRFVPKETKLLKCQTKRNLREHKTNFKNKT